VLAVKAALERGLALALQEKEQVYRLGRVPVPLGCQYQAWRCLLVARLGEVLSLQGWLAGLSKKARLVAAVRSQGLERGLAGVEEASVAALLLR
jgi:hypothetical protein